MPAHIFAFEKLRPKISILLLLSIELPIFVQPQFDRRSAETVAQALGATTAVLDPLAGDVLANLEAIATAIKAALRN